MDAQEFLAHHGIKGQKWGIRRFQNEDGSLTSAGLARYGENTRTFASNNLEKSRQFYKEAKKDVRKVQNSSEPNSIDKLIKAQAKKDFAKDQYKNEKAKEKMANRKNGPGERELALTEKYKKEGMSQKEAEIRAYRRVRAEKIGAIAAGVTITAAASYVAYKHWDATGDKFIKSGKTVQNISLDGAKDVNNAFYASYKNQDKSKFVGLFGGRHLAGKGDVYSMNASVKDGGIKIAGGKNAKKILEDALSKDADFRFETKVRLHNLEKGHEVFGGLKGARKAELFERNLDKGRLTKADYRFFNTMLVDHKESQQKITDRFYEELKKKGYDAVIDVNDKWQSGYNAKAPIIIFNGAEKLLKTSNTKLDEAVMQKGRAFWEKRLFTQQLGKVMVKDVAKNPALVVYAAVGPAAAVAGVKSQKKNSEQVHNKMITKYKREHPGTQLSNTEILKNIYGYS